jgi:hypothetical protein
VIELNSDVISAPYAAMVRDGVIEQMDIFFAEA